VESQPSKADVDVHTKQCHHTKEGIVERSESAAQNRMCTVSVTIQALDESRGTK